MVAATAGSTYTFRLVDDNNRITVHILGHTTVTYKTSRYVTSELIKELGVSLIAFLDATAYRLSVGLDCYNCNCEISDWDDDDYECNYCRYDWYRRHIILYTKSNAASIMNYAIDLYRIPIPIGVKRCDAYTGDAQH